MNETNHLNDQLILAKSDIDIRNQLIIKYKPLIIKTLKESQYNLISTYYDDLLSVGMSAFEEAIIKYDSDKGNFISFAIRIIKLRSIDFYRKVEKSSGNEVLVADDLLYRDKSSYDEYTKLKIEQNRIEEIEKFKSILDTWNITMSDLVKHSPKSEIIREQYKDLAKVIIANDIIYNELNKLKRLPINFLLKHTNINRRKVERGRIYIIAIVIILKGDFESLRNYID